MNKTKARGGCLRRLIKNWAVPVGCGLFFLFLLKSVFFFGYVPSASMEPAIREGSLIFGCRFFSDLERGDVVVFTHENRLLVKRVAGLPGDIIANGSEKLAVPDGCFYMLGDNEGGSSDSRTWEYQFVPTDSIIAAVWIAR